MEISKCNQTLAEMLHDRKEFEISRELTNNFNKIQELFSSKQVFHIDLTGNNKQKVFRIIYALQNKFKFSDIKKIMDDKTKTYFTIVVIKDKTNLSNIKNIEDDNVQIFQLKELQFNITHHKLVPKHELLTFDNEQEIQCLLQNLMIKNRYQLPLILKTDPVSRYLNAKPGNIIKITRSSPTSCEHIFFRCCL